MLTYLSNTEDSSNIVLLGKELFNTEKQFNEKLICKDFESIDNTNIINNIKNLISQKDNLLKKDSKEQKSLFLDSHIISKLSLLTNFMTESNSFTDTSAKLFQLCLLVGQNFEIDFYQLINLCYFATGKSNKFKARFLENILSNVKFDDQTKSNLNISTIISQDKNFFFEQIIEDSISNILNEINNASVEIIIKYCFSHYSLTKSLKLANNINQIVKESNNLKIEENSIWLNKAKFAFFDNESVDLVKVFNVVKSNKQQLQVEALVVDLIEKKDFKGLIDLDFVGINQYRYLVIYSILREQNKRDYSFEEISTLLKVSSYYSYYYL